MTRADTQLHSSACFCSLGLVTAQLSLHSASPIPTTQLHLLACPSLQLPVDPSLALPTPNKATTSPSCFLSTLPAQNASGSFYLVNPKPFDKGPYFPTAGQEAETPALVPQTPRSLTSSQSLVWSVVPRRSCSQAACCP